MDHVSVLDTASDEPGEAASYVVLDRIVKHLRDNAGNGQITFSKGFAVGICITLISCLFYVATWEVLYFNFMPGFMDKYSAYMVEKLKAKGASSAAIQAQLQQVKKYKDMYDNPLLNAAMTFLEPFPIGLVITLVSAAVLRRKPESQPAPTPLPAS